MVSPTERISRQLQLTVVDDFIKSSYAKINDIVEKLGWDIKSLGQKTEDMVICTLNLEHRVSKSTLNEHVKSCSWKQEGYHEQDTQLPESCGNEARTCIVIDKVLQTSIIEEAAKSNPSMRTGVPVALGLDYRSVPQTSNRIQSDFTSDERLALYDYVVSKTSAPSAVKMEDLYLFDSKKEEEKPHPKTRIELLIEERNAKRRRISYRNKVHTNRKSHTEIIREVIENQMEVLEEIIQSESSEYVVQKNFSEKYNKRDTEKASTVIVQTIEYQKRLSDSHMWKGGYKKQQASSSNTSKTESRCIKRREEKIKTSHYGNHSRSRSRSIDSNAKITEDTSRSGSHCRSKSTECDVREKEESREDISRYSNRYKSRSTSLECENIDKKEEITRYDSSRRKKKRSWNAENDARRRHEKKKSSSPSSTSTSRRASNKRSRSMKCETRGREQERERSIYSNSRRTGKPGSRRQEHNSSELDNRHRSGGYSSKHSRHRSRKKQYKHKKFGEERHCRSSSEAKGDRKDGDYRSSSKSQRNKNLDECRGDGKYHKSSKRVGDY